MSKDYPQTTTDDKGKVGAGTKPATTVRLLPIRELHEIVKTTLKELHAAVTQFENSLEQAENGPGTLEGSFKEYKWAIEKNIGRLQGEIEGVRDIERDIARRKYHERQEKIRADAPTRRMFAEHCVRFRDQTERWGEPPTDGSRPPWMSPWAKLTYAAETPEVWVETWFDRQEPSSEMVICRKSTSETAVMLTRRDPGTGKLVQKPFLIVDTIESALEAMARAHGIPLHRLMDSEREETAWQPAKNRFVADSGTGTKPQRGKKTKNARPRNNA
jgi:hypothetical protein